MLRNNIATIGLFSFLMIFSFISTSHAELWELIIDVNVQEGSIYPGETVTVTGKIVDHAYVPVKGIEVFIRAGSDTTKAVTDSDGIFKGEFKEFQRIPGTYIVNIIASGHGMTGMSSTQFQVKGDITPVSALQQKLSTEEARQYLSASERDFEKNPIGQTLFRYYHELLEELVLEKKEAKKDIVKQNEMVKKKEIAENLKQKAIEEYNPGSGNYDGHQYERYIAGLKPEIKELVISQLNFTNNMFENAQKIRDEIIANGGTYEEARQAYLGMISIPKEDLEQFNQERIDEGFENRKKSNSQE